jgi:LPXTG-motif cell wall-anchored protein
VTTRTCQRLIPVVLVAGMLLVWNVAPAGAEVITSISPTPTDTGWFIDPSHTGAQRLVEGPTTPPAGRGSLEIEVADTAQRALLTNALGSTAAVPIFRTFDQQGSFWTWVPDGATGDAAGVIKFSAFLDATTATGFTTVNIEPSRQGTVTPSTWQQWMIGPDTVVWQTNAGQTFCRQATPCTMSEFFANYANARWFALQIGLGSGAPAGASYVDNVQLSSQGEDFVFDFETPNNSTATIAPVTPSATGGTSQVTLVASADAPFPVVFTITVGGQPQIVTVDPGATVTVPITVPFGATPVTVSAQDATVASQTLTVDEASAVSAGTSASGELPRTGSSTSPMLAWLGFTMLALGATAIAATRRRPEFTGGPRLWSPPAGRRGATPTAAGAAAPTRGRPRPPGSRRSRCRRRSATVA